MNYLKYHIFLCLSLFLIHMIIVQSLHGQGETQQLPSKLIQDENTIQFAENIIDTIFVANVLINDSVVDYIIKNMLLKEEKCPYYDSNAVVAVRVLGVTDSSGVIEGEFCIRISMWDIGTLLYINPVWTFNINGHYGFIYGVRSVLDSAALFYETGEIMSFVYDKTAVERDSYEDDSHSMYEYWLMNHKWYYGTSYSCDGTVISYE